MNKLIDQITDADYDALEGINFSKLKPFIDSPYLFKKNIENQNNDDKTALKVGLAVHCLCLTPSIFGDKFAVSVVCDRRTKEGKLAWEEFVNNNQGKTVLSPQEFDLVANCYKAVSENKFFKHVHNNEDEIYLEAGGSTEIFGSKIKGRVDLFNKDKNVVVDLKTCSEIPSVDNIRKAIYKHKYHLQAYFYKAIVDNSFNVNTHFAFIFVDKKNFNSVGCAYVGREFFNRAAELLNETLCRYENCKAQNVWPSLPNSDCPMIVDAFQNYLEDFVDIEPSDDDNV